MMLMMKTNNYQYKKYLSSYLRELSILTNRIVIEDDLSSVSEVESVQIDASYLNNYETYSFTINFEERNKEQFSKYINNLNNANDSQVYLWTSRTNICGLFKTYNINNINFLFPFDLNDEGIFVLLTADTEDKLLLDFSTDSLGRQILEVESIGKNWFGIKYNK